LERVLTWVRLLLVGLLLKRPVPDTEFSPFSGSWLPDALFTLEVGELLVNGFLRRGGVTATGQ